MLFCSNSLAYFWRAKHKQYIAYYLYFYRAFHRFGQAKIRNGGPALGSNQFTAPAASKNDDCFKIGQN